MYKEFHTSKNMKILFRVDLGISHNPYIRTFTMYGDACMYIHNIPHLQTFVGKNPSQIHQLNHA